MDEATSSVALPQDQHGSEEPPARSLRSAAYLTAGVGLAHALLFLLAYWLISSTPGVRASDQRIVDYYNSDNSRRTVIVGLYIMPFAGIAFIWFAVALRMWISASTRRVNELLSNVQLVSAILFVGIFFAGAASFAVTAASVEFSNAQIDPVLARQFPQFGASLLMVFGMRMAAMFVFTTTNIGRHAGILPRWFIIFGLLVGVFLLLSATLSRLLVLIFPIWVLMLSAILFDRGRRIPKELLVPAQGPLSEVIVAAREEGRT
jgi:hypothetical protein